MDEDKPKLVCSSCIDIRVVSVGKDLVVALLFVEQTLSLASTLLITMVTACRSFSVI